LKTSEDDSKLVENLRKGDVDAFDQIYARYSGKLYAFGLKYLRSEAEASELVQSVFLKLWENAKTLRTDSSFRSYLFTIAYNDMCKLFRKRSYQQKFIADTLYESTQESNAIEEGIDYQSMLDRVLKIVDRLPERQKTVFLKSRQEGKSSREIAAEVGLSPGTVDNYISEALKFIRYSLRGESIPVILFISLFFL
jgi:RNA polymerase sigma-70 factor (family 1)